MNAIATLDQFDFHHRIGDTHGPALVLFHTPECASCRHWKQLLADYEDMHGDVTLYQVDVQRDMALAHEFGLFHLPALFLFMNGEFHCEFQSEARMGALHAALDAAIRAPPEEAP
jgi:thioredoxin-like negative regulator of GroEL